MLSKLHFSYSPAEIARLETTDNLAALPQTVLHTRGYEHHSMCEYK